jgi:hypothetical protein
MNPIVEKVKKLIALAGAKDEKGAYTNEARNAAVEACARIRQFDLRIGVASTAHQDLPFPPENEPAPTWRDLMRAVGVAVERSPETIKQVTETFGKAAEAVNAGRALLDAFTGKRSPTPPREE